MHMKSLLCGSAHPGLELQQVEPQRLDSGSQAQPEVPVLLPLVELFPAVLVELVELAALALVGAALVPVGAALVPVWAALVAALVAA